jgi:hypothetical protein
VRWLPASKEMSREAVESPLLVVVTKRLPVKTITNLDLVYAEVICKLCRLVNVIILCSCES